MKKMLETSNVNVNKVYQYSSLKSVFICFLTCGLTLSDVAKEQGRFVAHE